MKNLGWTIWGVSCFLLFIKLTGVVNKKGRAIRSVVCVILATALALTFFTPLSKFHLLWLLPLHSGFGFLLLAAMALIGFTRHKLTIRKPKETTLPANSFPPFGELEWEDDQWEGEILLPAWAGFQSRKGPYASEDSASASHGLVSVTVKPPEDTRKLTPTKAQCRALKFQLEHDQEVADSVLAALLPRYHTFKRDRKAQAQERPPVLSPADFRKLIELGEVHVLPHARGGLAYLGLEFGCDWDEEHGLGVVLHGKNVIDIGEASAAFDWQPKD